jgi:hypothetical protein
VELTVVVLLGVAAGLFQRPHPATAPTMPKNNMLARTAFRALKTLIQSPSR